MFALYQAVPPLFLWDRARTRSSTTGTRRSIPRHQPGAAKGRKTTPTLATLHKASKKVGTVSYDKNQAEHRELFTGMKADLKVVTRKPDDFFIAKKERDGIHVGTSGWGTLAQKIRSIFYVTV